MIQLEPIPYTDRDTALTGWLARPSGTPRAAVLVFPTIANVTPAIERRARMLADAGYLAMIADFYGEPVPSFDAAPRWRKPCAPMSITIARASPQRSPPCADWTRREGCRWWPSGSAWADRPCWNWPARQM